MLLFFELIETHGQVIKMLMDYRTVTVFAPTNAALTRSRQDLATIDEQFLLYHLSNTPVTSDSFHKHKYLSSEVDGNLPVWLWVRAYYNERELYVNNAKIIRRDIRLRNKLDRDQVLHIIDEVLEPIVAKDSDASYNNPDAFKFMANPLAFDMHQFQLTDFEYFVHRSPRKHVFTASEGSTYFMPVNSGFTKVNRSFIDNKVIDVHVIYDKVLFTRAFGREEFDSYADVDSVKVQLSLINETSYSPNNLDGYDLYVQSNTKLGDFNTLKLGVVVAKILRANVPIKNGVVHIIDRPLVAIEQNVMEIIEDEKDKRLSELYSLLNSSAPSLLHVLESANPVTFFAPCNEAFHSLLPSQRLILQTDPHAVKKLLELHMVPKSLTTQNIAHQVSMSVIVQDNVRKLFLRVLDVPKPPFKNYTVEGGGMNATIITPNMMGKNGVVHIIDRVLGIPVQTLYEVLKNDIELTETYNMGQQERWNDRFLSPGMVFTYFVPSNDAWRKVQTVYPHMFQQLQSGENSYHVKKILQHHLIVNSKYSMEELVALQVLSMFEGQVFVRKVFQHGETEYWLEWENVRARIRRPDVHTKNGVIHVIDAVLMKQSDLTVGSFSSADTSLIISLSLTTTILISLMNICLSYA
uniref:FAS1 domain-containing protein n=1 Tax=Strigamia maritima TaxID=126957 RepID=T1IHN2_STRMM